jgi:MFS family permease
MLFFWLGYSVYFTYTRMYVEDVLGQAYGFIALLIAAEEAPLLASLVFGGLADVFGRRRLMLLGLLEATAVACMGFTDIHLLPLLAAVASLFYGIAYTALTGVLLAGSAGRARTYSLVTLWGSVGWALGGPLAGLLYDYGAVVEFTSSALLVAVAYLVAYATTPRELDRVPGVGGRDVARAVRLLAPFVVFASLSAAGLAAFYGSFSLKLRAEVEDPLAYGLLFSALPALFGAAARPLAGYVCDRFSALRVAVAVTTAYLGLNYVLASYSGLVAIVAWLVPLYPFREVSLYMVSSRMLPQGLQATAGSTVSFSVSVAGFIVAAMSPLLEGASMLKVYAVTSTVTAAGLLALLPYTRQATRRA